MRAARELEMAVRLVGAATLVDGRYDVRVQPAFVDRHHPLAGVEGPFNAVMLQGDAIREITLEGPGAGGLETASAVVSDMISVIGTTGTGFLQNDACWRELERLPHGDVVSPFYVHLEVDDRPGVLADVARRLPTTRSRWRGSCSTRPATGARRCTWCCTSAGPGRCRTRSSRSRSSRGRSAGRPRCPSSPTAACPGWDGRDTGETSVFPVGPLLSWRAVAHFDAARHRR